MDAILQKRIPRWLKWLLMVLAHHCHGDSLQCWPSTATLADECECSERAIHRALGNLKQLGYVTVNRRQHQPTVFTLHLDKMPDRSTDAGGTCGPSTDTGVSCETASTDTSGSSQLTLVALSTDTSGSCNKEEQRKNRERATGKSKTHVHAFSPPTLEEVTSYCRERHNHLDPEAFLDHYHSNGWKVGRNPMKDWQAAVRTWERNGFHSSANSVNRKPTTQEILERELRIAKTYRA